MNAEFWVTIQATKKWQQWNLGKVSSSKKKPATNADEIAVKISIEVPDNYFEKPDLHAQLTLPVPANDTIKSEVVSGFAKELEKQMGMKVRLSLIEPEEDNQK